MTQLPPATADAPRRRSRLPAWLRGMRPQQWLKNVLVVAAPVAAGQFFQPQVLSNTAWAFAAFSLAASSIYLINDASDVESDRQHPKKRFRPIAAGELSIPTALVLAVLSFIASLALASWVRPMLGAVIVLYWVLQIGYTAFFKNQPILDLAMVASGFLLRAIAGGVACDIPLSQWFLLVASFGSLFMVAGKRYSEMIELGPDAGTRTSLREYTPPYLRFVWEVSAAVVIMSYSLWAFEQREAEPWLGVPWAAISIVPFALALLRYAARIDSADASAPEEIVIHDRVLQVLGFLCAIFVAIAVYL